MQALDPVHAGRTINHSVGVGSHSTRAGGVITGCPEHAIGLDDLVVVDNLRTRSCFLGDNVGERSGSSKAADPTERLDEFAPVISIREIVERAGWQIVRVS